MTHTYNQQANYRTIKNVFVSVTRTVGIITIWAVTIGLAKFYLGIMQRAKRLFTLAILFHPLFQSFYYLFNLFRNRCQE